MLLICVVSIAWSCARAPIQPKEGWRDVRIELDIYSGRPDNPKLEPTAAEAEQLNALLQNLTRAPQAPPEPGLGYRGFVITGSEAALGGHGRRLRVFGGHIICEDHRVVFNDAHGAESLLKQIAARSGYAEIVR